ncbi:MAG: acetate/propionate family kinase [Bdellovibrio sp.]|nr:acetate/propionate family kinase [Methylotenera sp.]
MTILVFNSGSSSLKFSFFRMESSLFDEDIDLESFTETILNESLPIETFNLHTLLEGEIELLSIKNKHNFYVKDASNLTIHAASIFAANHTDAVLHIIRYMASFETPTPHAIAHRVVHGGPNLPQHCLINDKVVRELAMTSAFAPLHNQAALEIIQYTRLTFPHLPQIACFDTTFHAHMPDVAKVLPIAKALYLLGIKRYGFHGLSCESVVVQLNNATNLRTPKRLIIAHLGNGASVTAVKNGQSVDTSMGFTPSGGVMMGSRCGDIDPGILIYLMREKKYDCNAIEALINHQSGLLGVSGISSDMRILHEAAATNPNAQLAIDMFCYSVAKQIGAMITVLNGVDTLVFTGGIGEHDAVSRQLICDQLAYLKIVLNDEKNNSEIAEVIHTISDANSACAVRVINTQENAQIARHAAILLELVPA